VNPEQLCNSIDDDNKNNKYVINGAFLALIVGNDELDQNVLVLEEFAK
jgi:hypothetical protein